MFGDRSAFWGQLFRVGGVLLLVGGVLGVVSGILTPATTDTRQQVASSLFIPSNVLGTLAGLLTVVGLPFAYMRFARRAGWIGLVGFASLMLAGMMMAFFGSMLSLLVFPWLVTLSISASALDQGPPALVAYFLVAGIIALTGAVLFGLSVVGFSGFSRWTGHLLVASGVANVMLGFGLNFSGPLGSIPADLFYVALGWIGYELWQQADEAAGPQVSL